MKEALKASVVIPTYNRPSDLENAVRSIINQSVKPQEIIIVDDGHLPAFPLQEECEAAGIRSLYIKKDIPGSAASKNIGAEVASGDIVFFFDDDVILSADYVAEVLGIYENDGSGTIGGVGGFITNRKPFSLRSLFRLIPYCLLLISGFREGRVLPSGFCTTFGSTNFPLRNIAKVQFLPGCAMSFRKKIFQEFRFSDSFKGYGLGEDVYFSYQVSKKFTMLLTPRARLVHLESPLMRPDRKRMGRMFILTRYLFFKDQVRRGWWSWFFFLYALSGYLLVRCIIALVSCSADERSWLIGNLSALKSILNGDLSVQ